MLVNAPSLIHPSSFCYRFELKEHTHVKWRQVGENTFYQVQITSAWYMENPKCYVQKDLAKQIFSLCLVSLKKRIFYLTKSSSSSLLGLSCLGWAILIQFGSDFKSLLMSSSFAQDALMTSFSSDWTMPLYTARKTTPQHSTWYSVSIFFFIKMNITPTSLINIIWVQSTDTHSLLVNTTSRFVLSSFIAE